MDVDGGDADSGGVRDTERTRRNPSGSTTTGEVGKREIAVVLVAGVVVVVLVEAGFAFAAAAAVAVLVEALLDNASLRD